MPVAARPALDGDRARTVLALGTRTPARSVSGAERVQLLGKSACLLVEPGSRRGRLPPYRQGKHVVSKDLGECEWRLTKRVNSSRSVRQRSDHGVDLVEKGLGRPE